MYFERLKRHISGPQEWKVFGREEDDDEIVADPNPEDPVEEVASDVEEESFVEEQRLSDAADELSEWGPASDSHPMQTRTRTALQEGRPRRRFEQYADYSSSDDQSVEVPDVRLPQKDNADDLFMEDLVTDSKEARQAVDRHPVASDEELFPNRAVDPKDWDRVPTLDDKHISDSSMPDFDDPLDSILRRQLPRQMHHPDSDDAVEETSKVPTDQKTEAPPAKRTRRPPQRYSPPISTAPIPGPSSLPTKTNQPKRRGRPKKDLLQTEKSKTKRGRRSTSAQTDSDTPKRPQKLRKRRRGRPPRSGSDTKPQPPSAQKDCAPPKRIPVKDRWVYTASSSDSDRNREDSSVPGTYTNAGTSSLWLTERQNKKRPSKRMSVLQLFQPDLPEEISELHCLPSAERDFNDRKPGRGTFGKSFEAFPHERRTER